ncbi:STM3941 family protein [Bradyrhizobium sp. ERR14]|uniref:STM3941 family protein n=1 Tax=Bradyrhizobium sp. ERR14 TaxID=2663837 RepID=UPI00161CA0BE|nr:STM3941 family protein [Bradyrhizobium sp. ERR14]
MAMLGKSMHAHPEGLAFGVADSQQSAMTIDASRDLEIRRCATRLRLLVAAGFAMTLLSASLAFDLWDGLGDYDTTLGYAGVALFGLVTCWLIWMLPAERGAVVVVTPYGIRDLRIGNEFLPWDSIAEISAEESRGHKMIVLTPTPALQQQLCGIRDLARCVRNDRIVILSDGLATDFDTLLHACRDCHAASTPRAALQQEDERGTQGGNQGGAQGFAVQAS